jgi:CheY-like chemotaxis protein
MTFIASILSLTSQHTPISAEPSRPYVLVVEDELILGANAAEAWEDAGYAVLTAASAEEAEVILSQHIVDVLFTDIDLGGRNGFELAARARVMQPNLPVVFTSGRSRRCLEDRLPNGATFLAKPYRLRDLVRVVDLATEAVR